MTRLVLAAAALLLSLVMVLGQGADERYVQIYSKLHEADTASDQGDARQAATLYREAQTALKNLQTAFPGWHENVVNFRLRYVSEKLQALAAQAAVPTNAPVEVATNVAEQAVVPASQLRAFQEEIRRLQNQNALLEAKVKEALAVQPAAVDPRELAKAEEKIRELQKERDLLKASLEEEKSKPAKGVDMAVLEQERQILAQVKQKLTEELVRNAQLDKENESLKQQIAKLSVGMTLENVGQLGRELEIARSTIAALQGTNTALRTEMLVMETRLAEAAKSGGTKEASVADLQRQLEAAQARLKVYESSPVPYTSEELVFFKQPDLKVAVSDLPKPAPADPPKRKGQMIPAGAGALLAEAQRAAETGRFEEAEQKYLQVLRQDENNVYTLANLAAVQVDLNRVGDAEKNLKRALALDGEDAATLFLYGRLKFMQEKYDEALDALSRAATLLPDEPRFQFYLGKTLIQKGNRAQAEKALRKSIQLKPGWGDPHYLLSVIYATQQPPFKELAQWHYKKAIAGGYQRNSEFEKMMEEKATAAAR
jgi:tetratricopeptide (TPR) repeat protein